MAEEKKYTVRDLVNLLGGVNGVSKNELLSSILLNEGYEDLDEEDQIVDADMPYEPKLKAIVQNANILKELTKSNPAFLKRLAEADLKNKSIFDPIDMSLDNIAQALGTATALKKEDILNNNKTYDKTNPVVMKNIASSYGWEFPEMLDKIRAAQTQKAREDIYDEGGIRNSLAKMMFPRVTKKVRDTGDYDWKDMTLDVGENILQAAPMFRGASTASFIGRNATTPVTMSIADYINDDDMDVGDLLNRAFTGTSINAAADKVMGSLISILTNNPAVSQTLHNLLSDTGVAYRDKLKKLQAIAREGRSGDAQAIKDALNKLTLLENTDKFKSGAGNIYDYAKWLNSPNKNDPGKWFSGIYKAKKLGENKRKEYEGELLDALGYDYYNMNKKKQKDILKELNEGKLEVPGGSEPWAVSVLNKQNALSKDALAKDIYTRVNREKVFPHDFLDKDAVGIRDGVLRVTPSAKNASGLALIGDRPKFNVYNRYSNIDNTVAKQLKDKISDKASKKFDYPVDTDNVIDKALKDPEMLQALEHVYGTPKAKELLSRWLTNKLGRSSWIESQKSGLYRLLFKEDNPDEEEDKK